MCCEERNQECIEAQRAYEEANERLKAGALRFVGSLPPGATLHVRDFAAYAIVLNDFQAKERRYIEASRAYDDARRFHREAEGAASVSDAPAPLERAAGQPAQSSD